MNFIAKTLLPFIILSICACKEDVAERKIVQETPPQENVAEACIPAENVDMGKVDVDTLKVEKMVDSVRLPDTSFASASKISYSVTITDKSSSGELASLEDAYASAPGIFTFRGGQKRDMPYEGFVKGEPSSIKVAWAFTTAVDNQKTKLGVWGGGSGWTGQPVYVHWPDSVFENMKRNHAGLTQDFSKDEIMVGSLSSNIYFINFENGQKSRKPVNVENPIKGSVSLDPSLDGKLYFGHGVPKTDASPFAMGYIDLRTQKIRYLINRDRNGWRPWGGNDASPLVVGQFLFNVSENGTIYKFNRTSGNLSLHSTLRYRVKGVAPGMESSIAVFKNYGYIADNNGNIICVNLDTMKPVWLYENHDDTDATVVVEVVDGVPYVYSSCEIDRQGDSGISRFVKLNGLTGKLVWEIQFKCNRATVQKKHFDGGMYSTPLLGRGDCDSLLFTTICTHNPKFAGNFVAINRITGKIVYQRPLKRYAWSSPVAFYDENKKLYVAVGDCAGNMYIFEGSTGRQILVQKVGDNFESSPVVVGNSMVVGSRGKTIYRVDVE